MLIILDLIHIIIGKLSLLFGTKQMNNRNRILNGCDMIYILARCPLT